MTQEKAATQCCNVSSQGLSLNQAVFPANQQAGKEIFQWNRMRRLDPENENENDRGLVVAVAGGAPKVKD